MTRSHAVISRKSRTVEIKKSLSGYIKMKFVSFMIRLLLDPHLTLIHPTITREFLQFFTEFAENRVKKSEKNRENP